MTSCDSNNNVFQIIGGNYGNYLNYFENVTTQRQHFELQIQFTFFKIGNWTNKYLLIEENGVPFFIQKFHNVGPIHFCGTSDPSQNDESFLINVKLAHQSSSINFTIFTNSTDNALWGLRDFTMKKSSCNETCRTCSNFLVSDCLTCYENAKFLAGRCECRDGFIMKIYGKTNGTPSAVCGKCFINCLTCFDLTENSCLTCPDGYTLSNNICTSESKKNQYFYYNQYYFLQQFWTVQAVE